jgi:hypothetical protein
MYAGPLRLVRALIVSATCVALSLASHVLGAGSGVPAFSVFAAVGLLMTTVLLMLVMLAVSGTRWTLGRALLALGAGQVVLHAIFTVVLSSQVLSSQVLSSQVLSSHHHGSTVGSAGGTSMALCHAVAALLVAVGIAANDSALDSYFCIASSRVGSRVAVVALWYLARRISSADAAGLLRAVCREQRFARWRRPRILTDLVVLHCLSRRGPPGLEGAS